MHSSPPPLALRRGLRRAIAALQRGAPQEAEDLLTQLITQAPDFADAWHYRALAAHQLDRKTDALAGFHRARELAPERADFAFNETRFHLERGAPEDALEASERAAREPAQAENATLLAVNALSALGRGHEAIQRLQAFLTTHPGARRARLQLIAILSEHGQDAALRTVLADALEHNAVDPIFGPLYVSALHGEGRLDEADALCRQLVEAPGSPATAWLEWAFSSLQRGAIDEAVTRAREALRRDPNLGGAWLLLAEAADPQTLGLPPAGRQDLLFEFARARLLDRRRETAAAWRAYGEANALAEREEKGYDRAGQESYVQNLLRHLDSDFIKRHRTLGHPDSPAIFICGISRSGTTLLEQMLAAHPSGDIAPGGEMKTIHQSIRRHLGPQGLPETGQRLARLPATELGEMLDGWAEAIVHKAGDTPHLTDKMPSNAFLLGLLEVAFPAAPIVLIERDPVAIACSCFVTPFAEGHSYSHRFADIQHYFAQYRRMIVHWEAVLPPGRIRHLRYEDLVQDPRAALSGLLASLGLDWDEAILEFYRRRDAIATASVLQVRRPLDPRATSGWKRFEAQIGPWRKRLEAAYYNGTLLPDDPT